MIHTVFSLEMTQCSPLSHEKTSYQAMTWISSFWLHASHRINNNMQVLAWEHLCWFSDLADPRFSFLIGSDGISKKAVSTGWFNNIWSDGIILTPYTFHSQVQPLAQSWAESWRDRQNGATLGRWKHRWIIQSESSVVWKKSPCQSSSLAQSLSECTADGRGDTLSPLYRL